MTKSKKTKPKSTALTTRPGYRYCPGCGSRRMLSGVCQICGRGKPDTKEKTSTDKKSS